MTGTSEPTGQCRQHWLSYVDRLDPRDMACVNLVVIHCTELPDLATARDYGEVIHYPGSETGNSGHFYVDRDGSCEQWTPLDRVAHHVRGHNARSVGIEMVNRGRYPDWLDTRRQNDYEAYPEAQITGLLGLLTALQRTLPALTTIAGHDQLDLERVPASNQPDQTVRRKLDPGPTFPWERVLSTSGLQRWQDP
ncbi:MAG: N-acetylmuramoyl-L-alanine amidase [Pseudomonadota bacterium]